jgi:hypothetical protein
MRPRTPYGTVSSLFWDCDIGWQLQAAGFEPLILALYLTANRHANMLGLYRLPLDQIGRELKVIPRPALLSAFDILEHLKVAFYDRESEFVWVREMAGQRMNPTEPEERLASKDNRWIAVIRTYKELPANRFLGAFFDEYHARLLMVSRRSGTGAEEWAVPRGLPSPFIRGLPSPLPSPLATTVEQVPEEQRDQTNRSVKTAEAVEKSDTAPEKASREQGSLFPIGPVPRRENKLEETPADAEEKIAHLVLTQLRKLQEWQSREELAEAALALCAQTRGLHRVHRSVVEAAIDCAVRQAREFGLEFMLAPGARLDAPIEHSDAG